MLDGLLGRGAFTSKCKSLIKPTKARIEVLRRRAEAKQRFLKEDLAKLLANGLDINAYGRTEEFLAGLNLLTCYNFIEQSCEYLLKQLSIMQKQSECPEDCRETVASLMFAAARFSDLPELRDLRDVFQERYGSALEYFVNQVFVERLASKPPVMEKRLQLLQDIAVEFSIAWDSKGFKQRMDKSSTPAQDQSKKHGSSHATDDKYKLPNGKDTFPRTYKCGVTSKERIDHVSDGHTLRNALRREELDIQFVGRQENTGCKHEPTTSKGESILKGENDDLSFRARREFTPKKHGLPIEKDGTALKMKSQGSSSREKMPENFVKDMMNAAQKGERQDPLYHGKSEGAENGARFPVRSGVNDHVSQQNALKSAGKVQEEEADRLNPCYSNSLPPPYVKRKDNFIPPPYSKSKGKSYGTHNESEQAIFDSDNRANVVITSDKSPRKPDHPYHEENGHDKDCNYPKYGAHRGSKHADFDSRGSSMAPSPRNGGNAVMSSDRNQRKPDHSQYEEHGLGKDCHYQNEVPLPKPRSMRRKHSKSASSHDDVGSLEDPRIVKERSSCGRRKDRKGLQILFDDEHHERDEEERMMDKLLLHYSKKTSAYDVTKLRKKPQSNASESPAEIFRPPTRSISVPREQTTGESQPTKVFARANSFQPDNQARHVHPKLPDYDDLAARFAALRGR